MPEQIVIADTSCFIILSKIGELTLLRDVYGEVLTTVENVIEFGEVLPDWVIVKAVTDKGRQGALEKQIDRGEASAIALALEFPGATIVLDDYKARRLAKSLGISLTGTVGIIIRGGFKEAQTTMNRNLK